MLLDSIPFTHPPCSEAAAWAAAQPSAEAAWSSCDRPDWMLWALSRLPGHPFDREIRWIACDLARSVLHLATPGDDRPRLAVEAAEACLRDPSPETRAEAAAAAAAGAAAAAARAAAEAAWAARAAAEAAWAAREARAAGAGTGCDAIRARVPWDLLKSALDARAGER